MKNLYIRLCNLELIAASICLITTVSIITLSAVLRTFGQPINWGLDIALWLFTWSVFLGADTALRTGKMINVDIFFKKIPQCAQRATGILIYLIIITFLTMLVVLGSEMTYRTRFRPFQGIESMSYSWVTAAVPICSSLMIITAILKIREIIVNKSPNSCEEINPSSSDFTTSQDREEK